MRPWLVLILAVSCTGERAPAKDTTVVEESPPADPVRPPRPSTWNSAAGEFFAVRAVSGGPAILVNPAYGDAQSLDTLTAETWNVEGTRLSLLDGAFLLGTGRVSGVSYDSTCAGWPTAAVEAAPAAGTWRVAFPEGAVDGLPMDSLPILTSADSLARTRAGALAASRLPDDTSALFRGRPFTVRQAHQFATGDTIVTMFEVVRLVAQEANPLQEQLLILTEGTPGGEPVMVFHAREVGEEENTGSIELLAALRVKTTGRLALLIRRERESGFVLEWIERTPRGAWTVSKAHNPIQDFYLRKVVGRENRFVSIAHKALADPARGCKM